MTKVQSLMNKENDLEMQNFIDTKPVKYGEIVEVTQGFIDNPVTQSLVLHNMIKIIEEPKVEKVVKLKKTKELKF